MTAFRLPARPIRFLLALAALLTLTVTLARAADAPVPSLDEQIQRAQADDDKSSLIELCCRRLDAPGADTAKLLETLFRAQLDGEEFPGAKATLDRLEKTSPAAAATVLEGRGDLAQADGKHLDEALAAWRAAVAAKPANAAALLGKIADALDTAGRWEDAATAFRTALRASPKHPARQARLAVCLLNAGHATDADKEIQAAVRADAADDTVKAVAPLFDRLRPQLPALKKLEDIIAAPHPAAPGKPEDELRGLPTSVAGARLYHAWFFYGAGIYAGALPDAAYAADATGGLCLSARLLQAQCLWQLERDKEAIALGFSKIADKKWFNDEKHFNRMLGADLAPTLTGAAQIKAYAARASILMDADQLPLALADAQRASEANTKQNLRLDDPEVIFAATLLRSNRIEEALAAARRATEYAPKNPDGWAILGRIEQESRADFATAAEHLSRALSMREEPRWLRRRETCLRTLGRNAEADRDAKRLAQLPPVT